LPKKTSEIVLLPPRLVLLSVAQCEVAVSLLAELLLDAGEAKRGGVGSAGVIRCVSDSAIGSVVPLPQRRRKGREVA
jgi:hypothetical protein